MHYQTSNLARKVITLNCFENSQALFVGQQGTIVKKGDIVAES